MKEHPTTSESEKEVAEAAIREFDKDGQPEAKKTVVEELVAAARLAGYNKVLHDYAWWKDGVQYVGSWGTTLKGALKQALVNCNR